MAKHILALIIGLSFSIVLPAQTPDDKSPEFTSKATTESIDSSILCEYCGHYQLNDNPYLAEVSIRIVDGKLMASASNYTDLILEPTNKDSYYVSNYHAKVVFTRKESIVTGVKISALALKFTGEKL